MTCRRLRAPLALVVALVAPVPAHARRGKPVTVRMPSFEVPARSNREVCTFVPVSARKAMDIGEVILVNQGGTATFGTHHMIVYAYVGNLNALTEYQGKTTDDTACLNLGPGDPRALQLVATSQLPESRQKMPKGTALRLEPRPFGSRTAVGLVLNSHWINGSDETQRARVVIKLMPVRGKRAVKRRLEPIFEAVASGFILVPPGETKTVGWSWGPGLPSFGGFFGGTDNPTGPACVTMLTGHTHRRGTLFTADLVEPDGTRERLYTNTNYAEPPMKTFTPPLLVRPGSRIDYGCVHDNATDPKLGCEEVPGQAPGRDVAGTFPRLELYLAAKGCRVEGPNPGECPPTDDRYPGRTFTGNCVEANLAFGFTSEDDMCIMPGYYYEPAEDGSCNL
jgi:hypothetical protein